MKKLFLFLSIIFILTTNSYSQFKQIGPYGGVVTALIIDPTTNYIYAGTPRGGVYISTDNGNNWSLMESQLYNNFELKITSFTINNDTIFAGTASGILKYNPKNNRWIEAGKKGLYTAMISDMASINDTLFICEDNGIYKSNDNGQSWIYSSNGISNTYKPKKIISDGINIYVGTYGGGVYVSSDKGKNWTLSNNGLTNKYIRSIAIYDNILFAGTEDGVYKSTDFGNNWIPVNNSMSNKYINSIIIHSNNIYLGTQDGIYCSNAYENNWIKLNIGAENVIVNTFINHNNKIYAGTSNGVLYSENATNWVESNQGLSSIHILDISIVNNNIFLGTTDGIYNSIDNGITWEKKNNGLSVLGVLKVVQKDNKIFAGTAKGLFLSTNNGEDWVSIGLNTQIVYDILIVEDTIYAATSDGVYFTIDNGAYWSKISNGLSNLETSLRSVKCLAIMDNKILSGTYSNIEGGGIYIMDNNKNWTLLNNQMTNNTIYSLKTRGDSILAGTRHGFWISPDKGNTWKKSLDQGSVFDMTFKGNNSFIGGYMGLFLKSMDKGLNWYFAGNGLPFDDDINSMDINGNDIFVGTAGSGVWKNSISNIITLSLSTTDSLTTRAQANSDLTFNIYSSTSWNVVSSTSWWLKPNITSGTGNATITLSVNENPEPTQRIGVVTVYSETERINLIVKQVAADVVLEVSSNPINLVKATYESSYFSLISNTSWTAYSDEEWIGINDLNSNGNGNQTISFAVLANPSNNSRSGNIIFTAKGGKTKTVTVIQQGCVDNGEWIQIHGPSTGNILEILIDPTTQYIYAGTYKNGIFRSSNNGTNWLPVNNGLKFHQIFTLTKINDVIYAGTQGGLYQSVDNGNSWLPNSNGLPLCEVYSLTINSEGIVFSGTKKGIFKSIDNCKTWMKIESFSSPTIKLTSNNNIIYAYSKNGVFKSINNGVSFREIAHYNDIQAAESVGDCIYVGTKYDLNVSTDNGVSWKIKTSANIKSIKIKGNKIIAGTDKGIITSNDNGETWTKEINNFSNTNINCIGLGSNIQLVGTERGVYISNNGSTSILSNNGILNASINNLSIIDNKLYACTNGSGICYSNDNGESWQFINNGLSNTDLPLSLKVNSIASDGEYLYAGTQTGLYISKDFGNSWELNSNFVKNNIKAIAINGKEILIGVWGMGLHSSSDKGNSWKKAAGVTDNKNQINSIVINQNTAYVGTEGGLFIATFNGACWSFRLNPVLSGSIKSIVLDNDKIFATSSGIVYFSSDGGILWNQLKNIGFPTFPSITSIAVIGNNIYTGFLDNGIMFSNNNGDNWSPINKNLSDVNISSLIVKDNYIYAGTISSGIWKRLNVDKSNILNISSNNITLSSKVNSTRSFTVTSNINWTATCDQNWLRINNLTGTNNGVITITADENIDATDRIATITLSGDATPSKTVTVTQLASGKMLTLIATPNSLNINSEENSATSFNITSNTNWEVYSNQSWLTVNQSFGSNNASVIVTATANQSFNPRTATITITGEDAETSIVYVSQTGILPILIVDLNTLALDAAQNSSSTFNITSNTSWAITCDQDWLNMSRISGTSNEAITVSASENVSINPRTATITINGTGVESKTITITQAGATPILSVNTATLNLAALNGSANFSITSNTTWTISSDQSWLSLSNTNGSNNASITVTASNNASITPRTATITITGTGVTSKTITINQAGATRFLSATPSSLSINAGENNQTSFEINSNVKWTISRDQNWLSVSNIDGENSSLVNVWATANENTEPRTATITITGEGVETKYIIVTQKAKVTSPVLTVSSNSLFFEQNGWPFNTVNITSNTNWYLNCDQPWILFSNMAGENNGSIDIFAIPNEDPNPRYANIFVFADNAIPQIINVTQAGTDPYFGPFITTYPNILNFTADASNPSYFEINSNIYWTITCDQPWISLSNDNGSSYGNIAVTALANESLVSRTATITIMGEGGLVNTINVIQTGKTPTLNVDPTTLSMAPAMCSTNFSIASNTGWTINSDQNWLSLSSDNGANNATITVTANENTSINSRTATITVAGTGVAAKTITVNQAGATPTLTVDQTALSMAAAMGSTNFSITSNTGWTISSDQNWISLSSDNGANNATIIVTANENTSINLRTATITVTGTGVAAKTITVNQAGVIPALTVDKTAVSMAANISSTSFSIASNTAWTISSDQSWLSLSSDNGANNATITVTANENTSINTRTATLTVTGTGVAAKTITVNQAGATPTLTVDQTALSMAAAMGSTNFSIASNTAWTTSTDKNWLSLSSDNGANNATITVNANENKSINPRAATITVTGTGVAAKTITVNQAGATPTLTVDQATLSMAAAMGSTNFSIASNTAWTISTDQNWLSLSSDNGANNATITVTANENTSINSRTATITVIGTGVTAKTITVNQAGATLTLTVDQTALSMDAEMGSTNFSIASNTAWSISTDQNWLSLSSDNGANNATITVTANENASINPRTATITVTGTGVAAKTISITQAGATPTLTVDQTALSMAAAMGSTNFSIASNTAWTISTDQDWLSLSSDNGANNAIITVTANENASINPRTATITVAGTGVAAKTITVNQAGATPTLTVDQATLSMAAAMGSTNFSIVSNIGWTISCDQSWINLSCTNGTNNGTITVSASENLHVSPRTATITVAGTGVTAKNITVNQSGAVPMLTVNPANIGIDAIANSSVYFEITSNIDWVINCSADWINIDKHSGSNNSTISIATLENISINPRTTKIQIIGNGTINRSIDVTQNGAPLKITVNPNSLNLNSAESSTSDFEINSNGDWALFSNQNWLKLNKTSGTGNSSITVTASANTNTSSRNAIVTVRGNNGVVEYVNVTQEPASPTLSVSSNNISVAASNGSTGSFKIYSNSNWVIESNSNWITLDKTAGFGYTQIGITVSQNPLGNIRSGQLTIKCNGLNDLVVNVNQSAAFINVSPLQITLNASQTSSTFNIMSNVGWSIEESQDWINLDRLQGSGSGTINLQATENTSTAKRTASITIKCSNNYYRTINLIQKGITATLEVYPNNLNFEFRETSSSFNIESNTHWKIKCDSPWLKITPTEGNGNSNINVTCTQNNSNNSRTTNITIVGDEINSNSTISVIQNALPHLIASPQSLELSSNEGSNFTLLISSNLNWTATVNQSWLTLSKSSGFGNSSILLTANANNDKSERIAILTLSADGINSQSVTIKQNTLSTGVESTNGDIIQIYPNPFNDKINLVIPEVALSSTILNVYSSYGVPVYSAKLIERNTEITLYDLKPGIYIAKIMYGDKIYSKVLIKI